jgi:streptogramin lyase
MTATAFGQLTIGGSAAATLAILALAAAGALLPTERVIAQGQSLLVGRITSSAGQAVSGVPVKAHRVGSNVTVVVYTNARGDYSFPDWSDLAPGSYALTIELPDFDHVRLEGASLSAGQTARRDFTLRSRQPSVDDATASEIVAALPGTDEQKVLFSQCSNCHTLQRALRTPHTKQEWAQIVTRMAGERNASSTAPGSMTYQQKKFIEPLAEYLASIRGPGSADTIPFRLRPRPTDEASTGLVVTEYEIPRGGARELDMLRGDTRFVWPHDVIVDANYAYYTDHFSFVLGRLDRNTGEAREFPFSVPSGAGRDPAGGDGRAGNPGGGAHDLLFDRHGNVVIGMDRGTVRYAPRTGQFTGWPSGNNMFGLDPSGNVWHTDDGGPLFKIDTTTGGVTEYKIPTNDGVYDMDTDSKGRTIINIWRNGKIGIFDPRTQAYAEYPTPTPDSGPRRGEIDAQDRLWVAEYYSGRLAMFDSAKGAIEEFALIPGSRAYGPPYLAPYTTSVDDKNQLVWTTDFNSSRIFRFDMKTGKTTEFFMPGNYEVRDLTTESSAPRPTLWIPAYRPPSKIVKVQVR